jgi:hypothetical protein
MHRALALCIVLAASPASADDYTRSDQLKWAGLSLGVAHLADHIVRNNHNGWPFSDRVTPATAAYFGVPALFGAGLYLDGPLYWVIADSVLLAGVTLTHAAVEHPNAIYAPWTNGSNMLEVESRPLGVAAVVVMIGTFATVGGHLASSIVDGRRHGFTWRRTHAPATERMRAVTVTPARGGGMVVAGWSF